MISDATEAAISDYTNAVIVCTYGKAFEAARLALVQAIEAEVEAARVEGANGIGLTKPVDPSKPDRKQPGTLFDYHTCWKCSDGARACAEIFPAQCSYPIARNH